MENSNNQNKHNKTLFLLMLLAVNNVIYAQILPDQQILVKDQLELFDSEYCVEKYSDNIEIKMHYPEIGEVVLTADRPWEGNVSGYFTIFRDENIFRMYYRGLNYDTTSKEYTHHEVTCYAESENGIHWKKPVLNLFTFDGSKKNNIVWDGIGTHNFTPFKDTNPLRSDSAKYKAVGTALYQGSDALFAFVSSDGIHWKQLQGDPIVVNGKFDSQNLVFWDPAAKKYRMYFRDWVNGIRVISTSESDNFIQWTASKQLIFRDKQNIDMYTNGILPYQRAPNILIGFPTKFIPSTSQMEPMLMFSRDGRQFYRWPKPIISIHDPMERYGDRSNFTAWGLIEPLNSMNQLSLFAAEAYYSGIGTRLRRFSYRVDGFTSIHASVNEGFVITKPFNMFGDSLKLNFRTWDKGYLMVEMIDSEGKVIDDYFTGKIEGDTIDYLVQWKNLLRNQFTRTVRLRFTMKNCDLYSFRSIRDTGYLLSAPIQRKPLKHFTLFQNYPNPFNHETTVRYSVPDENNISISVFNSLGQQVKNIKEGVRNAGVYDVKIDFSSLPSGVYLYRIKAESQSTGGTSTVRTKKMLYIK